MKLGGVSTPAPTSPSASFTVSPGITGTAPFNISVTSTSTGQSLTHSWDWGDGSPVEAGYNQVPHTYTDPGTYTITLTITQTTDGQQDTSTANITVTASSDGADRRFDSGHPRPHKLSRPGDLFDGFATYTHGHEKSAHLRWRLVARQHGVECGAHLVALQACAG